MVESHVGEALREGELVVELLARALCVAVGEGVPSGCTAPAKPEPPVTEPDTEAQSAPGRQGPLHVLTLAPGVLP